MLPLAVGVLGLSPADLADLTPSETRLALSARYAYDQRRDRDAWERARIIAWFTAAPHLKNGGAKHPKDLVPLPWDDGERPGHDRPKSLKELREYYANDLKRFKENGI